MRNPLRSEGEAYRLLWIVVGCAAAIIVAAYINTWLGVAVAVIAFAALGWWLMHEPVPGAAEPRAGRHIGDACRAPTACSLSRRPGTETVDVPAGAEVLVVVPALASTAESLTGAVDDRRYDAEATASALELYLPLARVEVGADDPALAVEDALRVFGADEVLVAGDDGMFDAIRERVALPVTRA